MEGHEASFPAPYRRADAWKKMAFLGEDLVVAHNKSLLIISPTTSSEEELIEEKIDNSIIGIESLQDILFVAVVKNDKYSLWLYIIPVCVFKLFILWSLKIWNWKWKTLIPENLLLRIREGD